MGYLIDSIRYVLSNILMINYENILSYLIWKRFSIDQHSIKILIQI